MASVRGCGSGSVSVRSCCRAALTSWLCQLPVVVGVDTGDAILILTTFTPVSPTRPTGPPTSCWQGPGTSAGSPPFLPPRDASPSGRGWVSFPSRSPGMATQEVLGDICGLNVCGNNDGRGQEGQGWGSLEGWCGGRPASSPRHPGVSRLRLPQRGAKPKEMKRGVERGTWLWRPPLHHSALRSEGDQRSLGTKAEWSGGLHTG